MSLRYSQDYHKILIKNLNVYYLLTEVKEFQDIYTITKGDTVL